MRPSSYRIALYPPSKLCYKNILAKFILEVCESLSIGNIVSVRRIERSCRFLGKEKLNELAEVYRQSPTNENFKRLYEEADREFGAFHRDTLLSRGCRDEHKAKETFDNTVFELATKEVRDFFNALSSSLRKKRLMEFRGNRRYRKRVAGSFDDVVEDDFGEVITRIKLPPDVCAVSAEDEVIPAMGSKKEVEKRQLLDILVDRANDPVAKILATKNRTFDCDDFSVNAFAKTLGIHHQEARRKLDLISRQFKPGVDGDILDYLPDGLRVKRQFLTA